MMFAPKHGAAPARSMMARARVRKDRGVVEDTAIPEIQNARDSEGGPFTRSDESPEKFGPGKILGSMETGGR